MAGLLPALSSCSLDASPRAGNKYSQRATGADRWSFVPMTGTRCMDGSRAGMGVYRSQARRPRGIMVFLEDGGASFGRLSRILSEKAGKMRFDRDYFEVRRKHVLHQGIFADRRGAPFANYHMAYIGYCSGDGHMGSNTTSAEAQQGFENLKRAVQILKRRFPSVERIAVVGSSAGGYGTFGALHLLHQAYLGDDPQLFLLNVSGPLYHAPLVPKCLQQRWHERWGLEPALTAACGEACDVTKGGSLGAIWAATLDRKRYRKLRVGLISTLHDRVIRSYLAHECADTLLGLPTSPNPLRIYQALEGNPQPGEWQASTDLSRALYALRKELRLSDRFRSFYFNSTRHIVADYDSVTTPESEAAAAPKDDSAGQTSTTPSTGRGDLSRPPSPRENRQLNLNPSAGQANSAHPQERLRNAPDTRRPAFYGIQRQIQTALAREIEPVLRPIAKVPTWLEERYLRGGVDKNGETFDGKLVTHTLQSVEIAGVTALEWIRRMVESPESWESLEGGGPIIGQ